MRLFLVIAALGVATTAQAQEGAAPSGLPSTWSCTESFPGGPRVCGSHHSTDTPVRIITRTEEVPVPVSVPVEQPPTVVPAPYPVFVPSRREREHYHPTPRRQLLPNHF